MRRTMVRSLRGKLLAVFAALSTIIGTASPAAAYQTTPGSGRAAGGPTSTVIDPNATVIFVDFTWIAGVMSVALVAAALLLAIRHRRRAASTSIA